MYEITCEKTWFTHIREGRKTVEGKKGTPTWAKITRGDFIKFICTEEPNKMFWAKVTRVNTYKGQDSLREYLENETLAKTLPGIDSLDAGENVYRQWWSKDEIKEYGVLAIHVRVIE